MAKDTKLLQRARDDFRYASGSEQKQREREIEDLKFQDPELQWSQDMRNERRATRIGTVDVPARPVLSISKLDQPINLIMNQARGAQLGINIHPLSPDADEDVADIIQGIYRQTERESHANLARMWALDRAVKAGRGYYRINTRYADEVGGNPFDQVITIERIHDQFSVYVDPAALEPNLSDAQFYFVTSWIPKRAFKHRYPGVSIPASEGIGDWGVSEKGAPLWVTGEDENTGAVQVAEYFYKELEKRKILWLEDGSIVKADEAPEGAVVQAEREMEVPVVMWCKVTGSDLLEKPVEWNGRYMPIIPVVATEYQPFDSQRRFAGIIRAARDAQRTYNYAATSLVERAALEPRAPFIGDPKQFEGYEEFWNQANTRNFPYLPAHMFVNGQPVPLPQRSEVSANAMGPSMLLLQQSDDFIQSTTSTPDPSLGNMNNRDRSGRAILALQNQSDAGNSHYIQNLTQISMPYEAMVVLDLMPKIYDRPERITRILDEEEKTSTVMLNAPFIKNPKTKMPIALKPGMPPPPSKPPTEEEPNPPPAEVKEYNLQRGIYGVSIDVGRAYKTRLEEGRQEIGKIIEAAPQLLTMIGPEWFKFLDFPGAPQIRKILEKMRDQQFPGLAGDDDEGMPSPEQLQSQLQQAQQQMQQMQQALQAAQQKIETDEAKQQATLQKAAMDNQTKLQVEEMRGKLDMMLELLKQEHGTAEGQRDRSHEMEKEKFEAAHEQAMTAARPIPPKPDGGVK